MTDKQIIIDDLDTRCPYHCNEKIGQCNNPSQETPHTYCINNKDCIYKQYARKEQECEELTSKCSQLEEENFELKEEVSIDRALFEEIDQLKAENEELKQFLSKEPLAIQALQSAYSDYKKRSEVFFEMIGEYKQTLAEIKEIAELKQKQSVFVGEAVFEQILNKINEVEDVENN